MAQELSIEARGLTECLRAFNGLSTDLRRVANGELRQASTAIGGDVVQPMLGGSGAPQEAAILAASGPKPDRMVVVAVPRKKPRLSGARRTPAAQAKRLGWALEGGSDYPPLHRPAEGSLVRSHIPAMGPKAADMYRAALHRIMARWGLL